ncbi:MAG: phage tail protein [Flavisolibacter sp.]
MNGVYGVVTCFAGNFAPRNWAMCNGQLLAINQNQALFSILGTTYGGNGTTNFALPDMRGRTAFSAGQGSGQPNYDLGQKAGAETTTLTVPNLPTHQHNGNVTLMMGASSDDGTDPTPNDGYPSRFTGAYSNSGSAAMLSPDYTGTISNAGGSQPFPIRSPFLGMNFIICLLGAFPTRN